MAILPSSFSSLSRSRWCCPRTTCAVILSCIILATTVVVSAEDVSAEDAACESGKALSCEECLQSQCAFYYEGSYGCLPKSEFLTDSARYEVDEVNDEAISEVCQRAADDDANWFLCGGIADCARCVETVLSDGESTCLWEEEMETCSGSDRNMWWGCWTNTCGASETRPPVPTCETATSCEECLQSQCVFYTGPGCMDKSVIIVDIPRYVVDERVETVSDVCTRAANDEADASLCGGMDDCSLCVGAVLSDGKSTCVWHEQFEFCTSEVCGLAGCGSSTCGTSRETRPPVDEPVVIDATTAPKSELETAEAGSGAPACSVRLWLSALLLVLAWN